MKKGCLITVALLLSMMMRPAAPAAVAGSFGLAWLLTRVPGIKKIL